MAHSYLYNKIWLANGNEPLECMTPNNIFTCPHTDAEYYHEFYWSNHITQFSILIAGIVFGVKFCSKKTNKLPKKSLIVIVVIMALIVMLVFAMGHFRTQGYYEGAYDVVMFDCFDERVTVPTLHAKIIYQNNAHIIDNKNCEWEIIR